ncbi:MAG: enoyl-CoA hydratase/isomerase family protein [Bacteroidetes bacterium]|nr:enoyl-CoA hydratase/isomerase family protein [Bacteroidota bacterium]
MIRRINKVAVLGSGIMGSGIACHFANIGLEVLLLDIVPRELSPEEAAKGLSLKDEAVRNRIAVKNLEQAIRSKPSPLYHSSFARRITTGNFDDHMPSIAQCDWVIEVVTERLDIKQQVFERVEKYRKPGSLVTTNTSGISIEAMAQGRSDDFRKHFCGTHFFNPPRYLQLFEIIPSADTLPEVVDFLNDYAGRFLGKTAVLAKNTPAFIANRIGTYAIMNLLNHVQEFGLNVTEIDKLTGQLIGRPKSATFRTVDIVGLDTLLHVAENIRQQAADEAQEAFATPAWLAKMLENKWLGDKTGQGFFKKVTENGEKKFLSLNFSSLEYEDAPKPKLGIIDQTKNLNNLAERLPVLLADKGKAGRFFRFNFYSLLAYSSHRIPEISDELYRVDDAMRAGFGWALGPFETWDALGVQQTLQAMEAEGFSPAPWVHQMLAKGIHSFYTLRQGKRYCYRPDLGDYALIPGQENLLSLRSLSGSKLWHNNDTTIHHLGNDVLAVEFHTKMNTIGQGVLEGLNKALDLAEREYAGLVIYNEGEHFSAGANVGMIYMYAVEQDFDELDLAVQWFQKTTMRLRYSSVPVVAAPHGMVLGGGCEVCMHADKVIAHAETYMGLVEFGVGLIPGGGGVKEFALRLSDELKEGDVRINAFQQRFLTIGQAKVSTSAYEAFDLGYLRKGTDEVIVSRAHQLAQAKKAVLAMAEKGYTRPLPRTDIKVLGREAMGMVYVGADSFTTANYMSEHDKLIAEKLGWVMAGGDVSAALTEVSEQYLLNLERKAFVELCMQRKTLERMQSLITTGKILRN